MKRKEPTVKTRRLILRPMSDAETEELIESCGSDELREAYSEMLAGCRRKPDQRIWYTPWRMTLKNGGQTVGDLCFKGPVKDNAVEIGYGVLSACEGQGYATEAVQAMKDWAFSQEGVVFLEAETAPDNAASQRVLEKCGFTRDGEGLEGPRFVCEAPMTNWMTIYMLLGMSVGTGIGTSLGNVGIGMSIGIGAGLCLGLGIDASAKKEREAIREARRSRKEQI